MFRLDPPDDDRTDPDRCLCGEPLSAYQEPDGELQQLCPLCDEDMIAHRLGSSVDPVVAELRRVREQLEAEVPESGEVPF